MDKEMAKAVQIDFYNHYHNGDIFTSREFIRQVMEETGSQIIFYTHPNSHKTTDDIIFHKSDLSKFDRLKRFDYKDGILAINTWIGIYQKDNHPEPPYFWNGGINYPILRDMWGYIFTEINKVFDTNLMLKPKVEDYFTTFNYEYYKTFCLDGVNTFLNDRPNKKRILFSNGMPLSGQSFASNLDILINTLAKEYPNFDFICTERIDKFSDNIFFTSDINRGSNGDLVEISYLSQFCDLIVGKNSGPFIYCLTKENLLDKNKRFLSFNTIRIDSLDYGVNINCYYHHSNTTEFKEIYRLVNEAIKGIRDEEVHHNYNN